MEHPSSEPQSMRDIMSAHLTRFEELANELFLSLAPQSSLRPPPAPPVEAFIECDAALAASLIKVREHQIKQGRIERLKEEIVQLEWRLKDIVSQLLKDKTDLETILREGNERIKIIDKTEKNPIPADYILSYAANIASFSSAPHSEQPPSADQTAPPAWKSPFPNETTMRFGILGSMSNMLPEANGEMRPVGEMQDESPVPPPEPQPPAERDVRHPGHYRPPQPRELYDFGLDLNEDD